MSSIGEKLRQERLRQNLDLSQLANETRIDRRFLEAIEAEEWGRLPGKFFINSFVRLYADALGVDAGEVDAELGRLFEVDKPASVSEPEHVGRLTHWSLARIRRPRLIFRPRGRLARVVLFVFVVLLCCGIFVLRRGVWRSPTPLAERPAATSVVRTESTTSRQLERQGEGGNPPSVGSQQLPPEQPATLPPTGKLLVSLAAKEAAWVSLTVDGRAVFAGILSPGDTKSFQGTESMSLRVGNAGGLEVHWNGQPVGSIGRRGEVRVVEFTRKGFQIRADKE